MDTSTRSVFISYRHTDELRIARNLKGLLSQRLGLDRIFFDEERMLPGCDFRRQSISEVNFAHSLIVVIGPSWLEARHQVGPRAGQRRLDDPEDVVRREIETALEKELFVYPLLVAHATMPPADHLPESLAPLLYRIYRTLDGDADLQRFVDSVVGNLKWMTLHQAFPDPPNEKAIVSMKRAFGSDAKDLRISVHQTFSAFCDAIYQRADELYPAGVRFPQYSYGRDWWLEKLGRRIPHAREFDHPTFDKYVVDSRPVIQAGVNPDEVIDFVLADHMPLPGDTKRLHAFRKRPSDRGSDMERAAHAIRRAEGLLITAGAGIGVDSGLPDFRGTDGFWRAYPSLKERRIRFEELANPRWFEDDPALAWGFYGHRLNLYRAVRPHAGFTTLLKWARSKGEYFIFTSNVDGQFQKAGFEWECLVECHGSIHHMQCTSKLCRSVFSADSFEIHVDPKTLRAFDPLPRCESCGSLLRPNIYMFEDDAWSRERFDPQKERYLNWLSEIRGCNLAVIEIGAGAAVPTVRLESEIRSGTLIRINPTEHEVPIGQLSIAAGASEALRQLDQLIESRNHRSQVAR